MNDSLRTSLNFKGCYNIVNDYNLCKITVIQLK